MQFCSSHIFREGNRVADTLQIMAYIHQAWYGGTSHRIIFSHFVIMIGWVFLTFASVSFFIESYMFCYLVLQSKVIVLPFLGVLFFF